MLKAFDGSFFKGRVYARQPENMIDVGNDREFGFLFEPPLELLERTFTALLSADLPPESPAAGYPALQLLQGARARPTNPTIQAQLLGALADPDAGVRETARAVVGRELALSGHRERSHSSSRRSGPPGRRCRSE